MFIGHFAVGMAAKRAAPRVSLPVLFLAAQFADILWPILVAAGIEVVRIVPGDTKYTPLQFVSYPWSHSLLMLIVWGALLGLGYRMYTGNSRGSLVIFGLVVSHWVLDWITHRPDMPLYPGGPKYGLALWSHPTANMLVEILMFGAGVAIYEGMTKGKNKRGQYSFWLLIVLLLLMYVATIGGAPPPNVGAIWTTALLAIGLIMLLAVYIERHRTLEHEEPNPTGRTRTPPQPFY